jgi:hypothetical protein
MRGRRGVSHSDFCSALGNNAVNLPDVGGPVDAYADYEPLDSCVSVEQPGVKLFRAWVLGSVEGYEKNSDAWRAADWGILRKCEPNRQSSKHQQGRAWDWHPSSPAKADTLIAALLADDTAGNKHALARRAGIRTIIWNKRIWHSGKRGWRDYRGTNPHEDHVHFGFGWAGAKGDTSLYAHLASESEPSPLVLGRPPDDNGGGGPSETSEKVKPCKNAAEQVPAKSTPLSEVEVARELARGFRANYGDDPSLKMLGVAWAQVQLETGRGLKLYNFNFGNITCGSSWRGNFMELRDGPNDPHFYRAYPSADAGARDYWALLFARYKPALAFYERGDAEGAARKLHELGYFTAAPEPIARTFGKLYAAFEKKTAAPWWMGVIAPLAGVAWAGKVAHEHL